MTDPFLEKAREFIKENGAARREQLPDLVAEFGRRMYEDGYQAGLREKPEE